MSYEEMLSQYGDTPLRFKSYYKYSFTLDGVADNLASIHVWVGGDSPDIYKFDISRDTEVTIRELQPDHISITSADGKEIFSHDSP